MSRNEEDRRDLEAALTEATTQLRSMPRHEILDEDLAWSFESGVYVEPAILREHPLTVRLEASKGLSFHRISATRTLEFDTS